MSFPARHATAYRAAITILPLMPGGDRLYAAAATHENFIGSYQLPRHEVERVRAGFDSCKSSEDADVRSLATLLHDLFSLSTDSGWAEQKHAVELYFFVSELFERMANSIGAPELAVSFKDHLSASLIRTHYPGVLAIWSRFDALLRAYLRERELEITFRIPPFVDQEEVIDLIAGLATSISDLHRALDGSGLKVSSVEIHSEAGCPLGIDA